MFCSYPLVDAVEDIAAFRSVFQEDCFLNVMQGIFILIHVFKCQGTEGKCFGTITFTQLYCFFGNFQSSFWDGLQLLGRIRGEFVTWLEIKLGYLQPEL